MCVLIFWTALRGSQNSSVALSQVRWIVDFGVRLRDKTPKSGVTHCKPSPSQESENEQIQNQIDAHLFFFTVIVSSTRNLCHQDKLLVELFIGKSLKDSGKRWHVCDQALHALGCCTTTTPHVTRQSPSMNFLQKKAFLWFLSPPIRRISVPVTSFYSTGSKTTWKDAILVLWIISRGV